MDLSFKRLQLDHKELKVKYLQMQHTLLQYMISEEMHEYETMQKEYAQLTTEPTGLDARKPAVPPPPHDDE